jgi:uncharacterized membrane protein
MPDDTRGTPAAAARNVHEIAELERRELRDLPLSDRISFEVTSRLGSFTVVVLHLLGLLSWALWNTVGPPNLRFDRYPFGLLTMIVSMEGVLVALLVLVTQNRMAAQSDQRDRLNLQVDLLAEQEMTMVLRMLGRISDHLGVQPDDAEQSDARELMEHTNVSELMEQLRRKHQ